MSEVHQVIRRCVSLRAMSEEDLQGKIWDRPHLSGPSIWNDDDLKIAKSNDQSGAFSWAIHSRVTVIKQIICVLEKPLKSNPRS